MKGLLKMSENQSNGRYSIRDMVLALPAVVALVGTGGAYATLKADIGTIKEEQTQWRQSVLSIQTIQHRIAEMERNITAILDHQIEMKIIQAEMKIVQADIQVTQAEMKIQITSGFNKGAKH